MRKRKTDEEIKEISSTAKLLTWITLFALVYIISMMSIDWIFGIRPVEQTLSDNILLLVFTSMLLSLSIGQSGTLDQLRLRKRLGIEEAYD